MNNITLSMQKDFHYKLHMNNITLSMQKDFHYKLPTDKKGIK